MLSPCGLGVGVTRSRNPRVSDSIEREGFRLQCVWKTSSRKTDNLDFTACFDCGLPHGCKIWLSTIVQFAETTSWTHVLSVKQIKRPQVAKTVTLHGAFVITRFTFIVSAMVSGLNMSDWYLKAASVSLRSASSNLCLRHPLQIFLVSTSQVSVAG
jgi:hypothetical protein